MTDPKAEIENCFPGKFPSPWRLCRNGGNGKNVMLNLFQHLINSMSYETLNQVQGDEKAIATQPLVGGGEGGVILKVNYSPSPPPSPAWGEGDNRDIF